MNSLIALGTGAAFIYSMWVVVSGGRDVYFEAAAVIIVLVLLGRMLEARARGRASDAIRKLMNLQPATARVIRDGVENEIPLAEVQRRRRDRRSPRRTRARRWHSERRRERHRRIHADRREPAGRKSPGAQVSAAR